MFTQISYYLMKILYLSIRQAYQRENCELFSEDVISKHKCRNIKRKPKRESKMFVYMEQQCVKICLVAINLII